MMKFADVAVSVRDAKAAAAWWRDAVGFRTSTIAGNEHAVVVAPPGDRFLLHLCEGYEAVETGNTGIAFLSDDLDAEVARMTAKGVRFETQAVDGMAKFQDPDGNVFWLIGAPRGMIEQITSLRADE